MGRKIFVFILFILILFGMLDGCSGKKDGGDIGAGGNPFEKQDFYMGTLITQKIYGNNAEQAALETSKRLGEIEGMMTINAPGGEINRLNDMAGKESVKLSEDTIFVLGEAQKCAELSGGAFDITIGLLDKAWGIFTGNPRIPEKSEINQLLKLVDYRSLVIDDSNMTAKLEKEGQIVDLGGIAKGYAGDEAVKIYKKCGIKSAYIYLGGNVVVLGSKPDGTPWRIGIQNPRAASGKYIGIVNVADKAVVTSGDYERYFEEDGIRYHHILDPKTGYPSNSGLMSTTIVADSSTDADALSTATFILGLERGMQLVEGLEGVEAIFVTSDKKVYTTKGLKDIFTFSDESKEFEYAEKG